MVLLRLAAYDRDRGIADAFLVILCSFHRKYQGCLQISVFPVEEVELVVLEAGLFKLHLLY